ncbi:MAG: glycoside hydrolase family 4 [Verrucomicrobiota bacterium]
MKKPKIVVLGAGSLFFGREAIWGMVNSKILSQGTLALVDTNPRCLDLMMKLGKAAIKHRNSPLALEGSTERKEVLNDADYVILSFSNNGAYYRGLDCEISKKYGVVMPSGDTIGPGGIFKTMRELPAVMAAVKDIEAICPDVWVVNYINPVAAIGLGLQRYAKVKNFSLCDGLGTPSAIRRFMCLCQIAEKPECITDNMLNEFESVIVGVNHFNWLKEAKYKGENVIPSLRRTIERLAESEKKLPGQAGFDEKDRLHSYALILWDLFGLYPIQISHTREYVRYFQGHGVLSRTAQPLGSIFDARQRMQCHEKMWSDVEKYINGAKPIAEFINQGHSDYAIDVIESMRSNTKKTFLVNTTNNGAVSNLPDNAFLELVCDVDRNGPAPRPAGPMPLGLRAMQMQVLDTHELTVEAVMRHDRKLLRRAFAADPIIVNIDDADAIINELFIKEKEALSPEWLAQTP